MKAAVLEAYHKPLQIRELEITGPGPDEVTIEVKACGLCSTDVHISEGAMLDLKFKGEMRIGRLYLDGKLQPAGTYNTENAPTFIKGTGVLSLQPSLPGRDP